MDDAVLGNTDKLPAGYFIYNLQDSSGIRVSPTRQFTPKTIGGTRQFNARSLEISGDGKWIAFIDENDGRIRVSSYDGSIVATSDIDSVSLVGFFRQSPFGEELFYARGLVSTRIFAVSLDLNVRPPAFGSPRTIVDVTGTHTLGADPQYGFSVYRDQVFGRMDGKSGYLTIPDSGRGIAGDADVYKWLPYDDSYNFSGCGHTMSHDGAMVLWNPGNAMSDCAPTLTWTHKGVTIAPFRRAEAPPLDIHTHFETDGISINWAPEQFGFGTNTESNFHGWYFSNFNDYAIGFLFGSKVEPGIWLLRWEDNTWFPLTPAHDSTRSLEQAVFFYEEMCTLTVGIHGAGTVQPSAMEIVPLGFKTRISASAAEGRRFSEWLISAGTVTFTDVRSDTAWVVPTAGNCSIVAVFVNLSHLTLVSGTHGSVGFTDSLVAVGHQIEITATPDQGYVFAGWQVVAGEDVLLTQQGSSVGEVTLTGDSAILLARFAMASSILTISAQGNGSVFPAGDQLVPTGIPIPVSARASSGFSFLGWTNTSGACGIADSVSTTTNVTVSTSQASLTATFGSTNHRVTILASVGGAVFPAGDTLVPHGDSLQLAATPIPGHAFDGWAVSGQSVVLKPDSVFTFVIILEQCSVLAVFEDTVVADPFDPRYRVIAPNGGETFAIGEACTVSIESARAANAVLSLRIGLHTFPLPGLTRSVNPVVDTLFVFVIPDSFYVQRYDPVLGHNVETGISTLSSECRIGLRDYIHGDAYNDVSDGFFAIVAAAETSKRPRYGMPKASATAELYSLSGRLIWCSNTGPVAGSKETSKMIVRDVGTRRSTSARILVWRDKDGSIISVSIVLRDLLYR